MRKPSSIAIALFITTLAPLALAAPKPLRMPKTITVEGRGRATVTPRSVNIYGTISTEHAAAADAGQNSVKIKAAYDALVAAQVPEKKITKGEPVTRPHYVPDPQNQGNMVQQGFITIQTLTVNTKAKDAGNSRGRIFDLLAAHNASTGVQAVITPKMLENGQQRAERSAIKNALTRAKAQVKEVGRKLGPVRSIGGSDDGFSSRSMALEAAPAMARGAQRVTTEFDVKSQTIPQTRVVEFDIR